MYGFMQRRKKENDQDALNRQQQKPEGHAKGNKASQNQNRSQMKAGTQKSRPVAPFNERPAQRWLQVCDSGPVIDSVHKCQINTAGKMDQMTPPATPFAAAIWQCRWFSRGLTSKLRNL
jgi:hypothetical protein